MTEEAEYDKKIEKREAHALELLARLTNSEGTANDQIVKLISTLLGITDDLADALAERESTLDRYRLALSIWGMDPVEQAPNLRAAAIHMMAKEGNPIAETLRRGMEMEKSSIAKQSGKAGSVKRHASMRELKQWTVDRFKASAWPSPLAASHELEVDVLTHGKKIGAHLSRYNAQRTIYNWLLESNKKNTG
jgi:hypothetical protein